MPTAQFATMGDVGEHQLDLDNPPFPLTAIDRQLLATKDEDFHRITWADLKQFIGIANVESTQSHSEPCHSNLCREANNQLEELKRLPSDLHKYLRWSFDTKKAYGSITNFVVQERLAWTPRDPSQPVSAHSFTHHSTVPFEDRRDYAILMNDWPYGFESDITHVLVWTRTPIAVDDDRGDVTPESNRIIEDFVERQFVRTLAKEANVTLEQARARVMWFKNWVSLQSVRGVDHVHVLVRDAPENLLLKVG